LAAAGGAALAATNSRTSCLVTREPDAGTAARLTACSFATFFAAGVAFGAAISAAAAGAAAGVAAGAAGTAAFDGSSSASTSPTFTSAPSGCLMLVSRPARSALTSRSIFSVSSSTSASPRATWSPSFLSQRAMRASTTDSPSSGTTMFTTMTP
jgi:cell division protein FtsW (lipid II flippase)